MIASMRIARGSTIARPYSPAVSFAAVWNGEGPAFLGWLLSAAQEGIRPV